ncbi:YceD family protein [Novosphingobium sp. JCM 18896]|uniref:YceD family protein n=1 Tax=Novosphingobium sp. JCM 18896 TaxID=2989731 RepID=UPI0022217F19|nr:DUF177 domain-containing protein [Novosphingobium sp. JCM 18896]MCW1430854.1 DUF177 domain-containing protein [Novosphingobium sp. JCM 18896]
MSEFARPFDVRQLDHRAVQLVADAAERAALAKRFDIVRIDRLEAEVVLERDGEALSATGTLSADIVQSCAVSAEDLPVAIREPLAFRFVPAGTAHAPDEEIELAEDELDEIEFTGTTVDLGEAVAQSVALAIDPFLTGPDAEAARALLKDEDASPFAALKGLKLGKD